MCSFEELSPAKKSLGFFAFFNVSLSLYLYTVLNKRKDRCYNSKQGNPMAKGKTIQTHTNNGDLTTGIGPVATMPPPPKSRSQPSV